MKVAEIKIKTELAIKGYVGNPEQVMEVAACLDELQAADFDTTLEAVHYAINDCHWELTEMESR